MSRINNSDCLSAKMRQLAEEHVKVTNPKVLKGQLEQMAIYVREFQQIYEQISAKSPTRGGVSTQNFNEHQNEHQKGTL